MAGSADFGPSAIWSLSEEERTSHERPETTLLTRLDICRASHVAQRRHIRLLSKHSSSSIRWRLL